jgi:SSS family solute:Na+ symporter
VIGLGLIFQSHGGFSFALGAAVAAAVIAVWALIGGLRGVAVTDTLQGAFMLGVAVAAVVWTRGRFPGLEPQSFPNQFWTPVRFIDLTLPWIFFALTNPQVLQRLFIPRDSKAFNRMVRMFALFGLLYTLLVSFLGFSARWGTAQGLFPAVADRDRVILELLARMRRGLSLALALSIVFASVTTANSIILSLSSMVSRDLFRAQRGLWLGKGLIALLTALVFVFSLTRPAYIVELSVASSSILLCYLPLLFGLFHGRGGGELTGLLTLLAGAAAAIVLAVLKVPLRSVYTLGLSFLAYFMGLLVERRRAAGQRPAG